MLPRMSDPKHLVRTRKLGDADYTLIRHPLNPASEIHIARLGDRVGMQRAHLSIARLPPGKESFLPHAHSLQEEFLFVLEGRGTAIVGDAEVEVGPGDYMGFPTDGTVHHLRNDGEGDLVYLMGGERTATEVSRFPSIGKVGVFDRGRVSFFEEASATVLSTEQWRPKK
jgi:uncharacterized cupin superfamily protein